MRFTPIPLRPKDRLTCAAVVDAVDQYPHSLWEPEGSILRPLGVLHEYVLASMKDPILGWSASSPKAHEMAYVGLLLWGEILFLMPVAVYGAWALWPTRAKKGTTGPQELLFLIWAFEMAFSTVICMNNIFWWDPVEYPDDVKRSFVFVYGPWVVVRKSTLQESGTDERCG
jgi:hypothetical protein